MSSTPDFFAITVEWRPYTKTPVISSYKCVDVSPNLWASIAQDFWDMACYSHSQSSWFQILSSVEKQGKWNGELLTPVTTCKMVSSGGSKIAASRKAAAAIMATAFPASLLERNPSESRVKLSSKRGIWKLFAVQISTREETESEIRLESPVMSAGSYIIRVWPRQQNSNSQRCVL